MIAVLLLKAHSLNDVAVVTLRVHDAGRNLEVKALINIPLKKYIQLKFSTFKHHQEKEILRVFPRIWKLPHPFQPAFGFYQVRTE